MDNDALRVRCVLAGALVLGAGARSAMGIAAFRYGALDPGTVSSARLVIETAGLTAHTMVGASQVNMVTLFDPTDTPVQVDLTQQMFGNTTWPAPAAVNQAPDRTAPLLVADIAPSFFDVLEGGRIGLWALLTDTDDAQFAIDTIRLEITTTTGSLESVYGSANDGFGIGLADGAPLGGLPSVVLPPGSTGTGFDETVSSKAIHVPAPGVLALIVACNAGACRRRGTRGGGS